MFFWGCQRDEDNRLQSSSVQNKSTSPSKQQQQHHVYLSQQQEERNFPSLSAVLPTLNANEPLELIAQANEAVCDRNSLLACKQISILCFENDLSTTWIREQVAQILARAYLLFGDIFPFTTRFPPVDEFFASIQGEEPVFVAIICKDNRKPDLLGQEQETGQVLDGLQSFPITYFRASPIALTLNNELHSEIVMISQSAAVENNEPFHLQDMTTMSSNIASTFSSNTGKRNRAGKTYFARKLYERATVVVCFPRTLREAGDFTVLKFLDRIERLFIF